MPNPRVTRASYGTQDLDPLAIGSSNRAALLRDLDGEARVRTGLAAVVDLPLEPPTVAVAA